MSISPVEAAALTIFQVTKQQPWGAATLEEEAIALAAARQALAAAHKAALEESGVIEAAANAISESSGMRFDGFWSRIADLEPEDRAHALNEARAALEAAFNHLEVMA